MEIFVSWSGGRSHQLANALKGWFEQEFADAGFRVFVSSEIDKGSQWFPTVLDKIKTADAGIVCITPEGLQSSWLAFESGALATAVALHRGEARIFTYLMDVNPSTLAGPLAAYQSTQATMEDTRRLLNSLLSFLDSEPVDPERFVGLWGSLEQRLASIAAEPVLVIYPEFPSLFDRKTFRDPIEEWMDQAWFARYDRVIATKEALDARRLLVRTECGQVVADLYGELVAQVDGFAMDLRALLFEPITFSLDDDGRRDVPPGIHAALERRRLAIHRLVAYVLDPSQQPASGAAIRFERAVATAEQKTIVSQLETRLRETARLESDDGVASWNRLLTSGWTLDRIAAYLAGEQGMAADDGEAPRAVQREIELIRTSADATTLPLQHSLRWLLATLFRRPVNVDLSATMDAVRQLAETPRLDTDGFLRRLLEEIEAQVEANPSG